MAVKNNPLSSIEVSGPIPAHLARSVIEESLRNAILDGRLPCGTAIRQQALASLFGVSRMPVREALRQLEAQGLLQVVQHKGAVVAPLIEDDALQTYELRLLLEAQALRLSLPLLTEADIEAAARAAGMNYVAIPVGHGGFSQTQVDARQAAEHGEVPLHSGNVHDRQPSAIGHAGQLTGNREVEDARAGLQAEYFSDLGA